MTIPVASFASPKLNGRAAALAAEAALLQGGASVDLPKEEELTGTSRLEEYAHTLEMKLAMKSALLEESTRLHQTLEERLAVLEEGISWKEAQLSMLERHSEEAWERAGEVCRERDCWRERAERLEEENCVLRDAVLERAEESDRLMQLLEVQQQAIASSPSPQLRCEEVGQMAAPQLHASAGPWVQQGPEGLGQVLLEPLALLELRALPPADAWATVGHGAADRFCGLGPRLGGCNGINVATGGSLPEDPEGMVALEGNRWSATGASVSVTPSAPGSPLAKALPARPIKGLGPPGQRYLSTDSADNDDPPKAMIRCAADSLQATLLGKGDEGDAPVNLFTASHQPPRPSSALPSPTVQHRLANPLVSAGQEQRLTPRQVRASTPQQQPAQAMVSTLQQRVIPQSPQLAQRELAPRDRAAPASTGLISRTPPPIVYRAPTNPSLAPGSAPPASPAPATQSSPHPPPPSPPVCPRVGSPQLLQSVQSVLQASAQQQQQQQQQSAKARPSQMPFSSASRSRAHSSPQQQKG